jgi:hypothetical protein
MVDAVKSTDSKIANLYNLLKEAKDPLDAENIQIQIDNLLDIRLGSMRLEKQLNGD